jgi:hypothetical protein
VASASSFGCSAIVTSGASAPATSARTVTVGTRLRRHSTLSSLSSVSRATCDTGTNLPSRR